MRVFFACLLTHLGSSYSTSWLNETCKLVDLSALNHCKGTLSSMIGHLIPASFNESLLDDAAYEAVFPLRACPAFDLEFQCFKFFPRCINISETAVYVVGMCTESCLMAKKYQGGFCETLDIDGICGDRHYFDPKPDCSGYGVDINKPDNTWQVVVGGILGGFGFLALCVLIIGYWRQNWKPDNNVDFEDERRQAEKIKKLQEKAEKQGQAYIDVDMQVGESPATRRWTSAQEAREEAATRQRQATVVREQELTEVSSETDS